MAECKCRESLTFFYELFQKDIEKDGLALSELASSTNSWQTTEAKWMRSYIINRRQDTNLQLQTIRMVARRAGVELGGRDD